MRCLWRSRRVFCPGNSRMTVLVCRAGTGQHGRRDTGVELRILTRIESLAQQGVVRDKKKPRFEPVESQDKVQQPVLP